MIKYLLFLVLFSFTICAAADEKIIGHMDSLDGELLSKQISLVGCGLTIYEWRGSKPSKQNIAKLNAVCKRAIQAFIPFVKSHGYKPQSNKQFAFSVALLPFNKFYRSLNDTKYRFIYRPQKANLLGYTSKNISWIFMIGDMREETAMVLSHEIFHAMSMHYGIYETHNADINRCGEKDEELADEFTESLGLGK